MRKLVALFILTAVAVAAAWWWLGRPLAAPAAATDPGRIQCMSYTPFRGDETPLNAATHAEAARIEEYLTKLARLTGCVRTYATDNGLDQVPAIAQRLGIKVLQGLWLGRNRQKNRIQIDTAIALAKRYPDAISGIVVGNEVLLRGELAADDIAAVLREVKAATGMPVTYADVWEFWLRHRELAAAVDFITIHILPYWEDFPIPAGDAAQHVDAIRKQVAAAFADKDVFVGEFGWPSAGRMREGALPSPVNQAYAMHAVLDRAKRENYRVNLIEAYDQPWKRWLEGTVGGHWGLFDAYGRRAKFVWGGAVSNHPQWPWRAAGGVGLAAFTFAAALAVRGRIATAASVGWWLRLTAIAIVSGTLIGWTVANVPLESLTIGDWLRSLAWAAVALMAPVVGAAALASGASAPSFAQILGRAAQP